MTKYDKLEAEYGALETPEQQWAWVLAHKDEVKLLTYITDSNGDLKYFTFKKSVNRELLPITYSLISCKSLFSLLSVLGIEAEGV